MSDLPLFFFDTDDGERVFHDESGISLASIDDVVHEARKLAFDLFYGAPLIGRTTLACVVRQESGSVIYRLTMDVSGETEATAGDPH